jgi:hypothetical protein
MTVPQPANSAETLQGRTIVVDGDSLIVDGKAVRIWGIDAPEMGTRSGDRAKKYLRALLSENTARCEDDGKRVSGQIMAKCFIGSVDIGRVMVLSGNARDWRRYSGGVYARELAKAGFPTHRRKQVSKRPNRRTRAPAPTPRYTAPATAPVATPQQARRAPVTPVRPVAPALRPRRFVPEAPFTPVAPAPSRPLSPPTDLRPAPRQALPPVTAAPRLPVEATPFVFPAPPGASLPPAPTPPAAKAPERQSEPAPPGIFPPDDED